MENVEELIRQYKKYIKLSDYEYGEFQRTRNKDHMKMVDYYTEKFEECGKKLEDLGVDTEKLYSEATGY